MAVGPAVCIIGAGAIGLATALHATKLGARVTVVEKDNIGAGSSSLSAGVVGNLAGDELGYAMGAHIVDFLPEARARGVQMTRCGYGRLAKTFEHIRVFESWVALHESHGSNDVRLFSHEQLVGLIPGYQCPDALGAVIDTAAVYLDGHQLCHAYASISREKGAQIKLGATVRAVSHNSPGFQVTLDGGARLYADVIVNAAGPWARHVSELLGQSILVVPQRHQVCIANLPEGYPSDFPAINEYIPGSDDYALYFRPEGSTQMLAGLHSDSILPDHQAENPDAYNRGVDPGYIDMVAERLHARFPSLGLTLSGGWSGLYPLTIDFKPIVGPFANSPEIITAAGFGGFGIARSFASGLVAAEWAVLGESRTIPEAKEYLPDRFAGASR